ncbi:IMV membrane protein [Swinepox virus]|uniref:IMV membrane protein n=1 Tax=Swinepox virus TaxID=10276 RepID=A0A881SY93_SWPV|nr:IMV membrane protein [Swinepox virus]
MITLFLILCYFILIFNIIIPIISEKMRREYDAYMKYKKLKNRIICSDNRLFTYTFGISGIMARMAIDNNFNPLPCSKQSDISKYTYISCDTDGGDIKNFRRSCSKAYLDLFFTT